MPNEDSRSTSPRRDGLRIGGWLETFRPGQRALTGRPPLVTPPPSRVPVFRPPSPPERTGGPAFRFAAVDDPRQIRLRVAVTALVAVAVGAVGFVLIDNQISDAAAPPQVAAADPVTLGAMPPPTSAAPTTSPPAPTAPATTAEAAIVSTRHTPPKTVHHTSAPPTHPAMAGVRLGDTLTYQPSTPPAGSWPGHSSTTSFVVRAASVAGCVMLEATDRPGMFLHSDGYRLRVEQPDGSAQFRSDASFCPVSAGTGVVHLRSAEVPSEYVAPFRRGLCVEAVPAAQAVAFTVHPGG